MDKGELPSEIYKVLDAAARQEPTDLLHQATSAPRDMKQVQNAKERVRQSKLMSQDSVYDVYQMSEESGGFVAHMKLIPTMTILCYKKGTV